MLLCSACSGPQPAIAQAISCRVILQFIPAVHDATDTALLAQLSDETGIQIHYDHALGDNQHLIDMSAANALACERAIAALKADSRVLMAQADTRKRVHS